jgi:hypothetical protein
VGPGRLGCIARAVQWVLRAAQLVRYPTCVAHLCSLSWLGLGNKPYVGFVPVFCMILLVFVAKDPLDRRGLENSL